MKIKVNKDAFLKAFSTVTRVVESKTTIPILSNVLLEASSAELKLTATDLDLAMRIGCEATVLKEGRATVPARKLHDYLKLLPAGEVTLELAENYWMKIASGRSRTKMVGIDPANFPKLPEMLKDATTLQASTLEDLIGKTSFAISKEDSRYTLSGVLLIMDSKGARMVATDGHRLALATTAGSYPESKVLIPLKALNTLDSILQGEVEFAHDESNLFFRTGGCLFSCRKLTGQFPNFEAVLPKHQPISVQAPAADLHAALRRVAQFADERSGAIRLALDKGALKLSAKSTELGESEESLEVAYRGEPLSIGFNSRYLIDYLNGVEGTIGIWFKDAGSAAEFRAAEGDHYRYVVMPMRV